MYVIQIKAKLAQIFASFVLQINKISYVNSNCVDVQRDLEEKIMNNITENKNK